MISRFLRRVSLSAIVLVGLAAGASTALSARRAVAADLDAWKCNKENTGCEAGTNSFCASFCGPAGCACRVEPE